MGSRATLGVALLVSTAAAGQTTPAAVACGPSARVEGDPEWVAQVAQELSRRGVDPEPVFACDAVRARVSTLDGRLRVEIASRGEVMERWVGSPVLAAVLIESWARTDLEGPLLAPDRPAPVPVARLGPVAVAQIRTVEAAPPASSPGPNWIHADLLAEATAGNTALGFGVFGGGCVRVGRVCLGAAGRFEQLSSIGNAGTERTGVDGLVTASLPLRHGSWVVAPSLGAGGGWLRTYIDAGSVPSLACGGSGSSPKGGSSGSNSGCTFGSGPTSWDMSTGGARLEAAVSASLLMGERWAFRSRLALSVAPGAHVTPLVSEPLFPTAAALAGEPLWLARIGVGLDWGGP